MPSSSLQIALNYASLGWSVFPVHSVAGGKCSCGKTACPNPGKHPRTRNGLHDATTDPAKITGWWRTWPDANIAVATGSKSGLFVLDIDPRHQGDDSLADLEQVNGRLATSIECLTGGGGRHVYFKYPAMGVVRNYTNNPGQGLDIRGDGGYVIAPPGSHLSGKNYEWEASSDPVNNVLEDAPGWLLSYIVELPSGGQQPSTPPPQPRIATAGGRNNYLTKQAGKLRRIGYTADEIETALLKLNQTRCSPPLLDDEVKKIARSINRYAPAHQPTDDELADQWLAQHPGTVYGLGDFRRYQDGYWPTVPYSQVEAEIELIQEKAKMDGYKPSYFKLKSILELSRIKSTIENSRWNADKDLLVCKNGTLHIPSMVLKAHEKTNYITAGVAYAYDANATAPTWDAFCKMILKDAEEFLQEFAGYSLTIDTKLETAVWLYGPPGSGKSTFISGLMAMLGNRVGILGLADLEHSRFSLTDLPDKTLLVSTEQPKDYVRTTEKINALISGEPVQIDRKFRDPITIQSFAKICWAMNELPRVNEANNGLFRRVKLIEFAELPEPMRNPNVKLWIQDEGSGILNWSLAGLARLRQDDGFTIPQCVTDASEMFRQLNDIPSVFIEECCEVGPMHSISSKALYAAYRVWCQDSGHKAQSSTSLALDWKRLKFKKKHGMYGNVWEGLTLKTMIP